MITFSFDTLWGLFTMVFWPFVRLLALFSSAPILSNRAIPTRVRVLLALLIALLIGPNIAPPPAGADPLGLLLQQLLIGIIVGFAMRIDNLGFPEAVERLAEEAGLEEAELVVVAVPSAHLRETARGIANTMPAFIACARVGATVGEMCDVLRPLWGEYEEPRSL